MEEGTDCCLLEGTFADVFKMQCTTKAFGHQRGTPDTACHTPACRLGGSSQPSSTPHSEIGYSLQSAPAMGLVYSTGSSGILCCGCQQQHNAFTIATYAQTDLIDTDAEAGRQNAVLGSCLHS